MFKIVEKRRLAEAIYLTRVEAPRIARSAKPGQFIIVRCDENSERIPLTIADYDAEAGTITMVTQALGVSTRKIVAKEVGESFADVAGPLGRPSDFTAESIEELKSRRIVFIGGGVGTAPVYPQVKWLAERGVEVDVIVGAKSRDMLIYREEMERVATNLYIATDDGSEGFHGLVTALLEKLITEDGKHYDMCVAIGPMIMMKFVTLTARKFDLPCIVSLNALMVDGTGMCGACRVKIAGKTKFTCVDGPEFNAYDVDFDEAMRRQSMYRDQEQRALAIAREREAGHKCNIGLDK
ncbi:MAG: sulfide/dihydroorotate dehydrogenase-like FAD/NAD-binding protein [Alistipes sp.]|nr:sulfide/dihydroorotate dehydrogenase-like FAD/NAD-binding protein [Alistipes sp.]